MVAQIPHLAFRTEFNGIARELITGIGVKNFEHTKEKTFQALWDTGATNSVITEEVVRELELKPIGMQIVHGVNSTTKRPTYVVNLMLPNKVMIQNVTVTDSIIHGGNINVIIGMDIIGLGDLTICNHGGRTTFCYSVPPHESKFDLVERANKINKKRRLLPA